MKKQRRKKLSKDKMHEIRELEQEKILLLGVQDILNQKELKMGELCAIVSHEFKTPLVPIKAYLEMLLKGNFGKLTKKQKEKISIIQANAERLFELIEKITEFKKIEMEGLKIQKKRIVLSQIIANAIRSVQNTTKENKINIIHDPGSITIICDPDRISTVLKNLIKNSLDFSTQSNRLGIYVKDNENEVEIIVKDNGIGIQKEEQKLLFEKFKQVDMSSTRKKGGLGLGLYLSKKIVELHGGKIWLESQPGKGTAVHFSLPKN